MISSSLLLLSLIIGPQLVAGYSFELTSSPTQCGQLHLNLTEGTGKPPYSVLVVPFGASPITPEKRTVLSHSFNGTSTSFQMAYPGNSDFVIVVGDANGIGTGGTSTSTGVQPSNDASCLPDKVATQFSFQLLPSTAINQCVPVTLAWDSAAQGDVEIQLVIPGGQTTTIPKTKIQTGLQGNTTGFSWTPNVNVGTTFILVAGDDRGVGTGGSVNNAIGNNPNGDSSCINSNSPSSTPAPAAGAVETGTPSNTGGGSSTNVGAIAGGVIAGVAAVIIAVLLTLFFVRRRRHQRDRRRHSLDLLPESGHPNAEQYQPEPFIIPSSVGSRSQHARTMSNGSEDDDGASGTRPSMSEVGRRYSALSTTDQSETTGYLGVPPRTGTGTYTSTSRKSPHPPSLRPVNFVQHEDAGELPEGEGSNQEPETVELPPTYDAIRR
ncbi:hypothetical protein Clacol_009356 [Clathrus columnatus]|uniref:Uncharacterized protein n=1 Tax=Clathrus columnatus TaxID=1419009 RepID=A0AAV5ARU6_9AGAM|nr:hypothetical protein Clacol_009356 [Clathrus columnatus]